MFLVLELGGAKYLEFGLLSEAEEYARKVLKASGCTVEIFGVVSHVW